MSACIRREQHQLADDSANETLTLFSYSIVTRWWLI